MSSYIRDYYCNDTRHGQKCLCIDDYFGQHEYGYLFKKDGTDATFEDFKLDLHDKNIWYIYKWEELFKPTD